MMLLFNNQKHVVKTAPTRTCRRSDDVEEDDVAPSCASWAGKIGGEVNGKMFGL
jgi:hypothetical protein